ncbi:MAG: hypothetical protein KGI71_04915 [Patescibacteria group bacterium]|nr:hypothetical protein [Patescibacteria group bacterium]
MFAPIDIALLLGEWSAGPRRSDCPICCACSDRDMPHLPNCAMDLALSERGWATQPQRDEARARILLASSPTLPPPPRQE